ncbi:TldD/PmbA family protein [Sulfitobacter geojensis]|uniref:TldD/PmbA family protein n=1 Tax=Sulfitobacter geojensis TaxID=1342299 RepID=A0AAE2VZ22_9RHOB|nr:TldD/PmbA family protein [Sulfitobacter geojensis]MBM1689726.1 TldD/PmbA family protein [Sulfitobacter geojensis]MBM1693792.1 TldD/PmbA family protein [Sulfitobacter geojensis]MBM1705958.1 TldD/PmbA family protein [Sulfitobacter geojensis]MBM1710016.1 TldD/PmbA family protein [Sulfitobacter geojensis]MBM1714082.1 TldD/PmbA family protein [Sulfitobacter geojensis]
MSQPLDTLTKSLLQAATKAGADSAEAKAVQATSLSVDVRGGALEQAERSEGIDIGLRVFVGQRAAVVSASDISARTIDEMAVRAVAMAREAPEDPYAGLAAPEQLAQSWDIDALELYDPTPEPSPEMLQEDAARAEAAALAVKGVTQVQSASAGYGAQEVFTAMTNGFEGGFSRTDRGLSCVAIAGAGTGMERDYDGDGRIFQSDMRSAEDIGQSAGNRAVERLDARKPPTGAYPVLFDERISSSLIGHLLSAVSGGAVARGASFLRDAMGQAVLPDHLSLIEDPHRPRASGSRPFDAEGLATRKRLIVENGILQGWTLDLANARKLGMDPTANAARSTSSGPGPTNWNVALTQGEQSRAELIRDMGTGLLVTSMIGSTINPNTGDYSRGAAGFWVENGEITHTINECTIAGNLREMLRVMIPANDARTHLSRVVPSLLVEGMTLAGA